MESTGDAHQRVVLAIYTLLLSRLLGPVEAGPPSPMSFHLRSASHLIDGDDSETLALTQVLANLHILHQLVKAPSSSSHPPPPQAGQTGQQQQQQQQDGGVSEDHRRAQLILLGNVVLHGGHGWLQETALAVLLRLHPWSQDGSEQGWATFASEHVSSKVEEVWSKPENHPFTFLFLASTVHQLATSSPRVLPTILTRTISSLKVNR